MRILIDTNILFSAILFPNSRVSKVLMYITENHQMYLCDQNIAELREVVSRKCPDKLTEIHDFLSELSYTLIPTIFQESGMDIRDKTDQPILNAAVIEDLDAVLTGDKDFLSMEMERPECLSVSEFCEKYAPGI